MIWNLVELVIWTKYLADLYNDELNDSTTVCVICVILVVVNTPGVADVNILPSGNLTPDVVSIWPLTNNLALFGLDVDAIKVLPFNRVVVTAVLPITTWLLSVICAPLPNAVELTSPSNAVDVWYPINVFREPVWFGCEPTYPALYPNAVLLLPVVFPNNALLPNATLFVPVVLLYNVEEPKLLLLSPVVF